MIKIGVIGYGYWGPNLVRNFYSAPGGTVSMVSDLRPKRCDLVRKHYPGITVTTDPGEVLSSPDVDAVVIATPVATHFDLAMRALRNGKHVLVEKPMTHSAETARQLLEEAEKRNLTLMVDHTFIYTGGVRRMKEAIDSGALGELYYYDSARVNLGLFQPDVDVVWDLAVHDLSILDYIIDQKPVGVSATGLANLPGHPVNTAYISLFFSGNFMAHVNVNWLSPIKLRQIMVGGSKKMMLFNELSPDEKLRLYDKGIDFPDEETAHTMMSLNYRTGDMVAPRIDQIEALSLESAHFVDCVATGRRPETDGRMGLRIVRILEAAGLSLKNRGAHTPLNLDGI
ncbi:MAG TPA: Gfo/Idh/MocA family oxidoreductase [Desulfovibrio sp.]|uniref:Gfo/Idh/MocA family protein n=1 Tax=Desulfovibrio sp. TaxID=885 RepID=UPI002D062F9E|nr:Gfo/Idh/MocA family oxidoreductase [Desulfovibrio sp.]HMM38437.1 Gfo/Idh/MocA family oxidoreductase [Desulfovibrio sp.]